jgi:hypothetical protein
MKIGIFAGLERAFPGTLMDRLNATTMAGERVVAELVQLGAVREAPPKEYDLIVDRISHEIYMYRVYCKVAALAGTYVINNPFWFSADDKFFGTSLARVLGVPVPKTVLLPSKAYPSTLTPHSFRNLRFPLDWEAIFAEIGFPAFLKQHMGGGWANVYKVHNPDELFAAYDQSGELVMMLQEGIEFEAFVRCLVIGKKHVMPIKYDPNSRRYEITEGYLSAELENQIVFPIRDGVPYAIDFTNPGPDFDPSSITPRYFEWVIDRFVDTIREILEQPIAPQPPLRWQTLLDGDGGSRPLPSKPAKR